MSADEVLTKALSLPVDERAEVARELLLSLEDERDDGDVEEAWASEFRRRLHAIRTGQVHLRAWDDVRDEIARDLANVNLPVEAGSLMPSMSGIRSPSSE
ncbi:MAG: addiction module protein [Planctomycetes bacterium]|nr:addiction module protein [Planctomycetota bacterium]